MLNMKNNFIVFLGITLLTSGIFVLLNNYFNEKVDKAYMYMNNLLLESEIVEEEMEIQEEVDNISDSTSSFEEVEKKEEKVDPYSSYYIGIIEIPKINFNRGFTAIDSQYNTVSKNVEVVRGSTYPDVKGGNLILAAHSGTSHLAYFKDLYKLGSGDVANIIYKNKKYTYKIVSIYEQDKTGKIAIYRDVNKTCLTLITCTKDKSDKQTVYILELIDVVEV